MFSNFYPLFTQFSVAHFHYTNLSASARAEIALRQIVVVNKYMTFPT